MSKANTKATINANIKQNGNQAITGSVLNSVMNAMVDDYAGSDDLNSLGNEIHNFKETDVVSGCPYTDAKIVSGSAGSAPTISARNPGQGYTTIDITGSSYRVTGYFYSTFRFVFVNASGVIVSNVPYSGQTGVQTFTIECPANATKFYVNSQGTLTSVIVKQTLPQATEQLIPKVASLESESANLGNQVYKLEYDATGNYDTSKVGRIGGSVGSLATFDQNLNFKHIYIAKSENPIIVECIPPTNVRPLTYVDSTGKVVSVATNITDGQRHRISLDWSVSSNAVGVYVNCTWISNGGYVDPTIKIYELRNNPAYVKEMNNTFDEFMSYPIRTWRNKVISFFGDSVTELNQDNHYSPEDTTYGDYSQPYAFLQTTSQYAWAKRVARFIGASALKIRGVGSQGFEWQISGNNGGSIVFVNTATGRFIGRMQGDLSTWDGSDLTNYSQTWSGNAKSVISAGLADGTIKACRGAGCSWSRITSMFPAAIKDNIDLVCLMFHNDAGQDATTKESFIANSAVDPEWAASGSNYYGKVNGDYNINTIKGAIASTIMKFQMWMPNAVLVLMTPISGVYSSSNVIGTNFDYGSMNVLADAVRSMHMQLSIPMIDVYGNTGINVLNRTRFIADTIHPRKRDGSVMIARAIIGGLQTILPMDAVDYDENNAL